MFSPTGPDAAAYGKSLGYPVGLPFKKQQNMVGNYSNADRVRPTRTVKAASPPSPLMRARQELSLTYTFDGKTLTLQDYLDRNPTPSCLPCGTASWSTPRPTKRGATCPTVRFASDIP